MTSSPSASLCATASRAWCARTMGLALLAALAAPVHAQSPSSVVLYGLIDLSAGRYQAPGGHAVWSLDSGKMTTSYLGLKGTESLGNGLSGLFGLEHFLRADTGAAGRFDADTFWARNAYVGLGGEWGTLKMGRLTTGLFVNTLAFNAFGDSFGFSSSIRHYFASGTVSGDSGWSHSVQYAAPKWGGLSMTAHAAAGMGNGGHNLGLTGVYSEGPLGVSLAWQNVKKGAAVPDTVSWQVGLSYKASIAQGFLQYGQVRNDTTGLSHKLLALSASVPVTPSGRALLEWGRLQPSAGATRTTLSLGYDHTFSKRLDAYAVVMADRLSGVGTGRSVGAGMRHRF